MSVLYIYSIGHRIVTQRRLRRAYANVYTHQSIRFSRTYSKDVDVDTHKHLRPLAPLSTSTWAFKGGFCAYAISTKILCVEKSPKYWSIRTLGSDRKQNNTSAIVLGM